MKTDYRDMGWDKSKSLIESLGFNFWAYENPDRGYSAMSISKPDGSQVLYCRVYDAHIVNFIVGAFVDGHLEVIQ
jgi:hypothetical protein